MRGFLKVRWLLLNNDLNVEIIMHNFDCTIYFRYWSIYFISQFDCYTDLANLFQTQWNNSITLAYSFLQICQHRYVDWYKHWNVSVLLNCYISILGLVELENYYAKKMNEQESMTKTCPRFVPGGWDMRSPAVRGNSMCLRRVSILAGTPGPTADAVTASSPSAPSMW